MAITDIAVSDHQVMKERGSTTTQRVGIDALETKPSEEEAGGRGREKGRGKGRKTRH